MSERGRAEGIDCSTNTVYSATEKFISILPAGRQECSFGDYNPGSLGDGSYPVGSISAGAKSP